MKQSPPLQVAACSYLGEPAGIGEAFSMVAQWVCEHSGQPGRPDAAGRMDLPWIGVYPLDGRRADVSAPLAAEVLVPFRGEITGAARNGGPVSVTQLPAEQVASLHYVGPVTGLGAALTRLRAWICAQGLCPGPYYRHVYHRCGAGEWEVELQIPVQSPEESRRA